MLKSERWVFCLTTISVDSAFIASVVDESVRKTG
jgi:hypothetical protein